MGLTEYQGLFGSWQIFIYLCLCVNFRRAAPVCMAFSSVCLTGAGIAAAEPSSSSQCVGVCTCVGGLFTTLLHVCLPSSNVAFNILHPAYTQSNTFFSEVQLHEKVREPFKIHKWIIKYVYTKNIKCIWEPLS